MSLTQSRRRLMKEKLTRKIGMGYAPISVNDLTPEYYFIESNVAHENDSLDTPTPKNESPHIPNPNSHPPFHPHFTQNAS